MAFIHLKERREIYDKNDRIIKKYTSASHNLINFFFSPASKCLRYIRKSHKIFLHVQNFCLDKIVIKIGHFRFGENNTNCASSILSSVKKKNRTKKYKKK